MAAKPEIVAYLQENMKKFSLEQLRGQLAQEGVSDLEFDEALKAAKEKPAPKRSSPAGKILLAGGLAAVVIAALVSLGKKPDEEAPPAKPAVQSLESAFVDTGRYNYVVRLPQGYSAVEQFKDEDKSVEMVFFCKTGTDPTQFLDESLFGQLGIVRLRAERSPFTNDLNGLQALTRAVTERAGSRGEKFTVKNVQISSMRGIQLHYDLPNARVEAYILGDKVLYSFLAGDEDDTYRDIVNSLRDANTET